MISIIVRVIVSIAFFAVFVASLLCNYYVLIVFLRHKRPGNFVPFIGGFCGVLSLAVFPWPPPNWTFWIPLVLDPGCMPYLAYVLILILMFLHRKTTGKNQ